MKNNYSILAIRDKTFKFINYLLWILKTIHACLNNSIFKKFHYFIHHYHLIILRIEKDLIFYFWFRFIDYLFSHFERKSSVNFQHEIIIKKNNYYFFIMILKEYYVSKPRQAYHPIPL